MENNIKEQKDNIEHLLYSVFSDLYKNFRWTVLESIITMQIRLGKENPYISTVLKDIYKDISPKDLEEHMPECEENAIDISEIDAFGLTSKDFSNYSGAFSKSMFNINMSIPEECKPWDALGENVDDFYAKDISMSIQNIKAKLNKLAMIRGIIARKADDFKDEITSIDILFEVLDFNFTI